MQSNIQICVIIDEPDLADNASRRCASQGWTVSQTSFHATGTGTDLDPDLSKANFLLFDELSQLPRVRDLLAQNPQQHALYLASNASAGDLENLGLPKRCTALGEENVAEGLIATITTALNVASFESQFFKTQGAEPITKLPHHAELLEFVQRFNGQTMGLIVVQIDHAEHLYADLDPVSKTDLLSALSEHLNTCLPHSAYMGIYDAASFAIWCPGMNEVDTGVTAEKLCERNRTPLSFRGGQLHFSLSAGAAFNANMSNPRQLWQQAWAAKEEAKNTGGNRANSTTAEREIGERIPQALSRDEFGLVLQPQWDIQGTTIKGVETLLRWQGMEVGSIAPDHFIPIAEESGQMARVGDWVLEKACAESTTWLEHLISPILLGINVSPQQFVNDALKNQIERLSKDQWLDPSILELELSHDKLLQVVDQHRSALFQLRDLGVRIAIDNLGTSIVDTHKLLRCPADTL